MEKAIGYISYTHGLDGKVKVVPMVKNDLFKQCVLNDKVKIKGENDNETPAIFYKINIFAFNGKSFICRIDGINSIDKAEKLTKKEIKVNIRNDDVLNAEILVGFNVVLKTNNNTSQKYGEVIDYGDYGAGDLLEIKTLKGKSEFIACDKANFVNIDYQNKIIILKPSESFNDMLLQ